MTAEDVFARVIGEVSHGPAAPLPLFEANGELHVLGMARRTQVGTQLGRALEHPDIDTVSGLILMLLDLGTP